MHEQTRGYKSEQSGATLIEALVSILILSLGLLGMASLQLNALSFQKSSWASQRMSEITTDISERMRTNPIASKAGQYNYVQNYATASTATLSGNGCRGSTSTIACTTEQIAQDDMRSVLAKTQQILPGGALSISGDSTAGFVITAMYQDKDFRDVLTGDLLGSTPCTSATSGTAWRTCCPATAAAPNGVRCARTPVLVYVAPD